MVKNPTIVVELRSHTDYRDTDEKNEILSQNRAQSCVDFLVKEKGIDADRIVPKGYGEYKPRKLDKDITIKYDGKSYTFTKGTELTEAYITALPTKGEQEAANALNRRTEFMILRDDYVPKSDTISKAVSTQPIAVVLERTIPITVEGEVVKGKCFANNKTFDFQLGNNSADIYMNYADATRFLKEMIITVDDFEAKDKAIKAEDGSIIEGSVLYLKNLKLGEDEADNVKVIVKKSMPAPFVIGSDYISDEFGSFVVDKDKKMIIFAK